MSHRVLCSVPHPAVVHFIYTAYSLLKLGDCLSVDIDRHFFVYSIRFQALILFLFYRSSIIDCALPFPFTVLIIVALVASAGTHLREPVDVHSSNIQTSLLVPTSPCDVVFVFVFVFVFSPENVGLVVLEITGHRSEYQIVLEITWVPISCE